MPKTTEDMIKELYTVVLGIPGTEEKGIVQSINEIEKHLADMNGCVKTNTSWRKALVWAFGLSSAIWTGLILHIFSKI